MKKILTFGITLLFLLMTVSSANETHLEKQSIKPFSLGNILYVGGNGPGNYTKIQDAIDNSSDGDIVYVYDDSSPYYEYNITINKSINLFGEEKNTTIIEGEKKYDVIMIEHDGVIISGFSIRNGRVGIVLNDVGNVEIHHVNAYNIRFNGISIWGYNGTVVIHHSILYNNGWNGIFIASCKNQSYDIDIHDNIIENNGLGEIFEGGIFIQDCYNCVDIRHNKITANNKYGIYLLRSINNRIFDNNFIDNERHAFFDNSFINRWYNNYWDNLKMSGLKIILGGFFIPNRSWGYWLIIPWVNFDWNPASEPYDIEV